MWAQMFSGAVPSGWARWGRLTSKAYTRAQPGRSPWPPVISQVKAAATAIPTAKSPLCIPSLDVLQQSDLIPFFSVTQPATDTTATADALLTTHVRYQGFQASGQTTPPVSFDQKLLTQLLALPQLAPWRAGGGLTVSGPLGAPAIKEYYAPFQHRTVARDAFLAGNDILWLLDFGLTPRTDQTSNIIDTLAYFAQRYTIDQTFAAKVDAAVARILALKLRLYGGQFTADRVLAPANGAGPAAAPAPDKVLALAQASATLITGSESAPPAPADKIVFLTDTRPVQVCASCAPAPLLDKKAFERTVLQLYGPSGSNQILDTHLQSFSFDDLAAYLNPSATPPVSPGPGTPTPAPNPLDGALTQANWLVFSMLDVTPAVGSSNIVSQFLSLRPDLAHGRHIIVFGFDAPYYLDTTDLSQIDAEYVLYSASPSFVSTAARLLFHELVPRGQSPVSVASVGYTLSDVTTADPARGFDLIGPTVDPSAPLKVGDIVPLATTVILDHNGHPVPDNTLVRFSSTIKAWNSRPSTTRPPRAALRR